LRLPSDEERNAMTTTVDRDESPLLYCTLLYNNERILTHVD
jgi:hypothetical protein